MRGLNATLNQPYKAKYFEPIPTTVNNHTTYTWDTIPQVFRFQDKVNEAGSLQQSIKGLTDKTTFIGGVFKTTDRKWRILTTNQYIDFKENGKVIISLNGIEQQFIITKITYKTGSLQSLASFRKGEINYKSLPKIIDLS